MATANELRTLSKKKQSPIDIIDDDVHTVVQRPLCVIGHWLDDGEAVLINNGHYPSFQFTGNRIPSIIKCGPLRDEYEFYDAHFHWGESDSIGSEHSLNGTWFSMESHLVHWNRKYGSFDECLKHEDGLCILAFFFLVKDDGDHKKHLMLEKITENLKDIHEYQTFTQVPSNSLCWIRGAMHTDYYYFYQGSYNEGDYPECAIWIVFPSVTPIRSDQLAEFRKLQDPKGRTVYQNRRKRQHLHGRKVYKALISVND